jgi:hypothetical protein
MGRPDQGKRSERRLNGRTPGGLSEISTLTFTGGYREPTANGR